MPKLIFTPQELKNYFSDDAKYRHCFYQKSVDMAKEMCVHADGLYPCELLDCRRPNEPLEVMDYRKTIFIPKTKPYFSKIISSLQKIRRSSDWSIRYEGDFPRIPEDETLQDYCEEYFPQFTSITNWVFSVLLKKYLIDPNALIFVYPKSIDPLETPPEENQYLQPIAEIVDSCYVLDYVYDDYAVFTNPVGCIYRTSKGAYQGKSFWVVTTQTITRYDQVDGRGTLSPVINYDHGLGVLPVYRIGAVIVKTEGYKCLYESRISGIIPEFNEAIREYSDLQAAKVLHIYPERWEFTQHECQICKGTGKRRNPIWFDGCDATIPCDLPCDNKACHNGYVVAGPYSKMLLRPPNAGVGEVTNVPIPPAGFVEKDVEIVKVQEQSINDHIKNGLASINFEFIMDTPLAQSGIAKETDKDELNNTVHSVAEDLVRCMDWEYYIIAKYRYGLIYSEEDIAQMVPKIPVPEKYDILSSVHVEAQLKNVKESKANPAIINAVETEYASKAFNNDPSVKEFVSLVLSLDPLANIPEDEKMTRLSNKGITQETYVISSNIQEFVQRAMEENEGFADMELSEQKDIIQKYATEQIENQDSDLKVDMPTENVLPLPPPPDNNQPPSVLEYNNTNPVAVV